MYYLLSKTGVTLGVPSTWNDAEYSSESDDDLNALLDELSLQEIQNRILSAVRASLENAPAENPEGNYFLYFFGDYASEGESEEEINGPAPAA